MTFLSHRPSWSSIAGQQTQSAPFLSRFRGRPHAHRSEPSRAVGAGPCAQLRIHRDPRPGCRTSRHDGRRRSGCTRRDSAPARRTRSKSRSGHQTTDSAEGEADRALDIGVAQQRHRSGQWCRWRVFNSGLKAMIAEVAAMLLSTLCGELHPYISVLAHWRGIRLLDVPVVLRPRLRCRSPQSSSRLPASGRVRPSSSERSLPSPAFPASRHSPCCCASAPR